MQHHAAREMTSNLHGGDTRHNFLGIAVNEDTFTSIGFTAKPRFIFCGEINRAVERLGPNQMGSVVMWVRYHDCLESAKRIYLVGR